MILRLLLCAAIGLAACDTRAQDTLFYTNGKHIVGQVDEIGVDQVRFRTSNGDNTIAVTAQKDELARLKLQNGQEFVFNEMAMGTGGGSGVKQAISMQVLAPALNHIAFGYERNIAKRVSLCARAGYIGFWDFEEYNSNALNSRGCLLVLGAKFILPRRKHGYESQPLAGWYLRPDVLFSMWEHADARYYYPIYPSTQLLVVESEQYASCAVNLTIGTQVMLGKRFTFDVHGGAGYGLQWIDGRVSSADNYNRQHYSFTHAFLGDLSPLTVSGGMSFGYAF